MVQLRRTLYRLPGRYAIHRLDPDAPFPHWAFALPGEFVSVTRTGEELSVICPLEALPDRGPGTANWYCLRVAGPVPTDEPGVLASVVQPLAEAGLSVFAVATYDTDHLLVTDIDRAVRALTARHDVLPLPDRNPTPRR
jgi:hypothetical protein